MTHAAEKRTVIGATSQPRRLPLNIGTSLVLATVISLVIFLATSDGGTTVSDVAADAQPAQSAVAETMVSPTAVGDEAALDGGSTPLPIAVGDSGPSTASAAATVVPLSATGEVTNLGPTEVGYVTNFPAVDYTWQRIDLDGAGLTDTGWLGEMNGQLVSISAGWAEGGQGPQTLLTQVSEDGLNWQSAGAYELPADTWISRVAGSGDKVIAIGQQRGRGQGSAAQLMFTTTDGVSWSKTEIALPTEAGEQAYVQDVAVGPAGIVLSVQFESSPEGQPARMVFERYEVLLDYMQGSYTLTDTTSGEVVLTGSTTELLNQGTDGQRVFDPATGELLTTVPWQVWEQAWNNYYGGSYGGSPLPLPIDNPEPEEFPQITVEYDGYVISVDERNDSFVVTDATDGGEVAAGTLQELYQGPPPTFRDVETGDVLLAVSWDEWYAAEEGAYAEPGNIDYNYRSRATLVTSTDGENWQVKGVGDGMGGSTSYLAATEDGFVAMVNTYGEYGGDRSTMWQMVDGNWSSTPAPRSDLWLNSVVATSDGLVGVGDGAGGPALWSSPDGVNWQSEFAIVPQDDGSYAYLTSVAADQSGTIGALAVRQLSSEYQPLAIDQEKYTATFEEGDALLTVTETVSGTPVLTLGWQDFDNGAAADLVTWDGEATSIDLGNGDVMVITDEEARAAIEAQYAENGQTGLSVFLNEGSGWTEAIVDVDGGISAASQLFLADGRIIVGGNQWDMAGDYHYEDGPGSSSLVIIVGTPNGR